jgi:hypothetical protein
MVAFVCARQSLSFNAAARRSKRETYREYLRREFISAATTRELPRGACYGIVYYFLRARPDRS